MDLQANILRQKLDNTSIRLKMNPAHISPNFRTGLKEMQYCSGIHENAMQAQQIASTAATNHDNETTKEQNSHCITHDELHL